MTTIQLTQNQARPHLANSASTQVKMFVNNNPRDVEKLVSQWLNENDVTIHHVTQSQSEKGGHFVFVITLFYLPND